MKVIKKITLMLVFSVLVLGIGADFGGVFGFLAGLAFLVIIAIIIKRHKK
jgi:hypothetical protein